MDFFKISDYIIFLLSTSSFIEGLHINFDITNAVVCWKIKASFAYLERLPLKRLSKNPSDPSMVRKRTNPNITQTSTFRNFVLTGIFFDILIIVRA